MKNSSLRRVDALGVAAVAAMTALAYLIAVEPVLQSRRERIELVERLDSETIANRNIAEQVKVMEDTLQREQDEMASYPIRLTTQDEMNRRIADIVKEAQECHLAVRRTEPGELERSDLYGVVGVRLEGKGDYQSCVEFLHRLAKYGDLGVRSLSLISQPQDPYDDPLFNFHLLWFVQLDQTEE